MAHPDYIRLKAIQFRVDENMTIDDIADRLALSRTTVFYWVENLHIPETQKQSAARQRASDANSARARAKREAAYAEGVQMYPELILKPTFRDFICMYIGDGYKRNRNRVSICNSDPEVVKLGDSWIKKLSRNCVGYSIQHYADQSIDELRGFWATYLDIDPGAIKFQGKSNSNQLTGRKWRSRHGVLDVGANDTHFRAQLGAWMNLVKAEWR